MSTIWGPWLWKRGAPIRLDAWSGFCTKGSWWRSSGLVPPWNASAFWKRLCMLEHHGTPKVFFFLLHFFPEVFNRYFTFHLKSNIIHLDLNNSYPETTNLFLIRVDRFPHPHHGDSTDFWDFSSSAEPTSAISCGDSNLHVFLGIQRYPIVQNGHLHISKGYDSWLFSRVSAEWFWHPLPGFR